MVNDLKIKKDQKDDRLSMQHSLIVWIAGAVLGWVVAVMSVWTVMTPSDNNIADRNKTDAEKLEQVMPAAGEPKDEKNKEE